MNFGYFDDEKREYVITRRIHRRRGRIIWGHRSMVR